MDKRWLISHVPELLRQRAFRNYWIGQSISLVGDEISRIALPLVAVLILDAQAGEMGGLTAAALVPALLFSVPAGAWADRRRSRRRVMLVTDLGRFLLMASVPVAYAWGVLNFVQLCLTAFAIGTLSVLFNVCDSTLYVSLVPAKSYVQGSSLMNGSRSLAFTAGPSLGGLLVQFARAPFALFVDALSYLLSALFLFRISPAEPPPSARRRGHFTAGLKWLVRAPLMRPMLAAVATLNFFNFIYQALFVLYATKSLGVSSGALGIILGSGAVGGLIGAAFAGRVVQRIGIGPAIIFGFAGFSLPLVLVPLAGGPELLSAGILTLAEFLSCFGVMILDITSNAFQTALIPDALRSRIAGVQQTIGYGVRPLGALAGGALGTAIGLRPALWVATVGAGLSVLWLLPTSLLRTRELPAPIPAPDSEPQLSGA
ncbi:MFS transporter [Streptomyces kasugaensis]|uniref:MFS transporter n=1 Tax=Streptomyces kasugaensis TaxID=1946 RepID=A0A4Q9HJY3_STRKA|nr:MFS transporter [Streptomyces kasugaensis]